MLNVFLLFIDPSSEYLDFIAWWSHRSHRCIKGPWWANEGRVEILNILIKGKNNGFVFGNKRARQSLGFHGKQLKRLIDFPTINRTFYFSLLLLSNVSPYRMKHWWKHFTNKLDFTHAFWFCYQTWVMMFIFGFVDIGFYALYFIPKFLVWLVVLTWN